MAAALTTTLTLKLNASQSEVLDLSTIKDSLSQDFSDSLANGTAANQADLIFHDQRTVTAAAEDLDLAGSLTDKRGNTLTFVEITCILIHNLSTTTGEVLTVGGDANALVNWVGAATHTVKVDPDGLLLWWSPIDGAAVVAGTGDILQIDPGAKTITYDIIIIGRSA